MRANKTVQLFHTDFIKNKTVQRCTLIGFVADFACSQTFNHALTLFFLPYITSVCLKYFIKPAPTPRYNPCVSAQFKSSSPRRKIKIIPR